MPSPDLDQGQLDRYARQIVMDDIGPSGQAKLLEGSVLVVGVGGLGAPVVQYLAAAGVGTLGLVDDDIVERSNLQRQVVHGTSDIGRAKVDSAAEFVAELNPDVTVDRYELRFDGDGEILEGYDVVVDATDSLSALYALNDACTAADRPLVHGAVSGFDGQVSTFDGGDPCYRCLFPEAPPDGAVPDCATAGVLGAVPSVIGSIQASEAIKLLLDIDGTLTGRLLRYDARSMSFSEVGFESRPDCQTCGGQSAVETAGDGPKHSPASEG
ncbi:molybdopterin-synthase adenylyltransferase MoeB [Halorhabdus sp. BNX81]|uniref:HesA/MoeB/ThiF family protein n=1 Tax=Halorhabdus sp. BNX81 TaxID=2980181 RepID=UPI0023DD1B73|nr:molybdopterin-synthase adenylyltransferase MoeB [Halorhabdus sp. BNX81]WEL21516.1 Dinucleotide-utilizing enzyme involved in molybdopterin and thiamine biosynthesis [Halorhabdus sp. BNX81]